MHAYGFDKVSFKFIDSYLAGRKQRVKTNSSFREWSEVLYGVPQDQYWPLFSLTYIYLIRSLVKSRQILNLIIQKVIETLEKMLKSCFSVSVTTFKVNHEKYNLLTNNSEKN